MYTVNPFAMQQAVLDIEESISQTLYYTKSDRYKIFSIRISSLSTIFIQTRNYNFISQIQNSLLS